MKDIIRAVKFWWQRRTRGFDDSVTWSLDYSLAKLIWPRLRLFREHNMGHPYGMTEEEWLLKLDCMIRAFVYLADESRWKDIKWPPYVQEGLNLFAEYYGSLWT